MRRISLAGLGHALSSRTETKHQGGVKWHRVLGVFLLFSTFLVLAVFLHLNLTTTRRLLNRALTQYLDQELVGTVDLGRIDRLDASTVWLSGLAVYDSQHRRVLTVNRLRARTKTFQALFDWLTSDKKLTIVVETIWADGVNARLFPTAVTAIPSLALAFGLDATREKTSSTSPTRPYRIALSDIVLSDVEIENQLSPIPIQTAKFKRLAGLVLITPDGVAVSVKRFGMHLAALSNLEFQGTGTLDFRSPNRIWGEVSATLGTLPFTGRVDYRDEQLNLNLDAPKMTPEQVRTVLPTWPLRKTASVFLITHGPLSALATQLTTTVEQSKLEVFGTTGLSGNPSGNYSLSGQHIDLSAFFGAAVPSDLDLRAKVEFHLRGDSPEFRFDGLVDSGTLLGQKTPSLDLEGKQDASGLILGLRSHDAKLPLRAGLWMHEGRIELDAQTRNVSLGPLLRPLGVRDVAGYATLRARGTVTDERVAVETHATITQAAYNGVSASALEVDSTFEGPKNEPLLWKGRAQVTAKDFRSPYVNYPSIQATLLGTPTRLRVTAVTEDEQHSRITLDTDLYNDKQVELRGAKLGLRRGAHQLELRVQRAAISETTAVVQGIALSGSAGDLIGELAWQGKGGLTAQLASERLDLAVLNDLLSLPPHYLAGTASAKLDLDTRSGSPRGNMQITLNGATAGTLTNLTGSWEQTLTDRNLKGSFDMGTALVDRIHGQYDLKLDGPITATDSFLRAVGNAQLDFERFRLEHLGSLTSVLPENLTTQGTLSARVTATRSAADLLPNVLLSVTTDGLGVRLVRASGTPITVDQIALLGNVEYEGVTGTLKSDWVVSKLQQPRAIFGFTSQLDLQGVITDPRLARSRFYDLPFDAWLQLPRQSLSELETMFGVTLGTGTVQTKLWLKGPLTDPHLVVDFQGEQLSLAALGNPVPLDAQGIAEFAHRNGETRVLCSIGTGNKVWAQLNAVGSVFANPDSARQPNAPPYDWSGKLDLGFTGLPLEAIPGTRESQVTGLLRGGATVTRSFGMTTLSALVPIADLKIQSRPVGQSLLSLHSEKRNLVATAKLIDGGAQVDFEGTVPVDLSRPLPTLLDESALHFTARAAGYDAGILAPFLDPYLGQIQGELSGNLEATYRAATATVAEPKLALGGKLQLRNGRGRLRALSVNLTDISMDAQASSTGSRTLIHVPSVTAAMGTSTPNVNATVVIELEHLQLKRLGASVTRAEAVPLILDGVSQAKLTGTANVEITPSNVEQSDTSGENGYAVEVTVGELSVNLPREQARTVVALSENTDISVLQPLGSAAFKKTQPSTITPYRIRLALGKKTRVSRKDFDIPISGSPVLLLKDKLYTSGSIQLEPGGRIQLAGKTFIIETGRVTLNPEEPSNPRFEVEAQWRGPTHTVIATVTGTRKEAELHLSSDPPLGSESQVLALLLSGGNAEADTTTAGLGVGATLFNEFLSETPLSSVELRTSQDEQHANYTAAVPLKENLWFEGTYQNATNNSLRPNSTTAREGFSGTVDWRFHRNWSLRTEVGTLGAGADLLWQYRY